MPRRRGNKQDIYDDLLSALLILPWWVGPPLVVLTWLVFHTGIPLILNALGTDANQGLSPGIISILQSLAPILAGVVLIVWSVSLVVRWRQARTLDKQTSIESIRNLTWREFEQLVAEAFRRQGYTVRLTPEGPDGGIDLVITKKGTHQLVQCKQWRTRQVGVKPIRELAGVVASEQAAGGIFVTSGTYTTEASSFASQPHSNIRLIDGRELLSLVASVQSKPKIEQAPTPQTTTETTSCPQCGENMVRRVAKRGPQAGSEFWGCSKYPQCRGTRSI